MRGLFQPNVACDWVAADGDRFRFGIRRDCLDDAIARYSRASSNFRSSTGIAAAVCGRTSCSNTIPERFASKESPSSCKRAKDRKRDFGLAVAASRSGVPGFVPSRAIWAATTRSAASFHFGLWLIFKARRH